MLTFSGQIQSVKRSLDLKRGRVCVSNGTRKAGSNSEALTGQLTVPGLVRLPARGVRLCPD